MGDHESFYTLLNLEKACPRRTIFRLKGIKGISQYYHARKSYERNRIYQYITDKFHLDTRKRAFQEIDEKFIDLKSFSKRVRRLAFLKIEVK